MCLFKKNAKKQLTIHEKWALDCESFKNPNYKVKIGEIQCYKCKNRIRTNTLKCSKFDEIESDILRDKKKCAFRVLGNENDKMDT